MCRNILVYLIFGIIICKITETASWKLGLLRTASRNGNYFPMHRQHNKHTRAYSSNSQNIFAATTINDAKHLSANKAVQRKKREKKKAIVFIDGTWLYYSLFYNKDLENNPVTRRIGLNWYKKFKFSPEKLCQLVVQKLNDQVHRRNNSQHHNIEIAGTHIFTSTKIDTFVGGSRDEFFSVFKNNPSFNMHVYESRANEEQEKCVDVAMAVEMVHLASVAKAFDVAVVVGGDRDFMPALEKTKVLGKKIAICSVRTTCNKELIRPDVKDYDVIWLDEAIDVLFEPRTAKNDETSDDYMISRLMKIISTHCDSQQPILSRTLGRLLSIETSESGRSLIEILRNCHGSLKAFVQKYPNLFVLSNSGGEMWEFSISIGPDAINRFRNAESINSSSFDSPLSPKKDNSCLSEYKIDENYLLDRILQIFSVLEDKKYTLSARSLSEAISSMQTDSGKNCLDAMKASYRSLRAFLTRHQDVFILGAVVSTPCGFEYNVTANPVKIAEFKLNYPEKLQCNFITAPVTNSFLEKILMIYGNLPHGQNSLSNRDLGRVLSSIKMDNGKTCLEMIKSNYYCIGTFMNKFPKIFSIGPTEVSKTGYEYLISVDPTYSTPYKTNATDVIAVHPEVISCTLNQLLKGLSVLKEKKNELFLNDVIDILSNAKWKNEQSLLSKLHDLGISVRSFIQYHDHYFSCGPYKLTENGYEQSILVSENFKDGMVR